MGPPNKIRGIYELLCAFEKIAAKNKEICLVCLFREDGTLDTETINKQMAQFRYKNRIIAIWQSLPKDQLTAFLRYCRALMQPFVLIPSEIPLAIIESMALGTPVIISNTEGSGRFTEPFGLVCRAGDIGRLAKAMTALLEDNDLLATKRKAAIDLYSRHPSWREVAQRWLAVGESLAKG
jgi:glycosyltransferase involved in cell wall biosynthesis